MDNTITVDGYILLDDSSHEKQTNEITSEYICRKMIFRVLLVMQKRSSLMV
jgi:hypothetical protein